MHPAPSVRHATPARLIAAALACALVVTACGSDGSTATDAGAVDATTDDATTDEVATDEVGTTDEPSDADDDAETDTASGADETTIGGDDETARAAVVNGAPWSDNVTIIIDGDTVHFSSDGLPSHEYLDTYLADGRDGKYIAGGVEAYDADFSFPLVPTMADSPSETGNGAIGVAVSGAVFFDPYEGDGSDTIANDDNSTIDGIPFIDACGGHPLPNSISYHYHGIPFCITDALDTDGEHSALIGYLFDGHPIYGPQDVDGEPPTDLDACSGHVGPTPDFDVDVYHYHVTSTANYISECLVGVSTRQGR